MSDPCAELDLLLMAYADGEASVEERERVEAHVATCQRCAERLADWQVLAPQTDRLVAGVNASYSPRVRRSSPARPWPAPRGSRAVAGLGVALCLITLFVVQLAVLRRPAPASLAPHPPLAPPAAATVAPVPPTTAPVFGVAPPSTPTPRPFAAANVPSLSPTVPAVAPASTPPTAAPTVAAAAPTPSLAGQIAFVRDGNLWLHSATGDAQLTHGLTVAAPRWSPTGHWLLYETAGSGGQQAELWLLQAADVSTPERLLAPADSGLARWSPARDELAVAAPDGSLWLVQPRGGAPRPLLAGGGQVTNLTWSADGRQLAVERRGVGVAPQSLWLVTSSGTISGLSGQGLAGPAAPRSAPTGAASPPDADFSPTERGGAVPVLGAWNPAGTTLNLWLSPTLIQAPNAPLPLALWSAAGGARVVLPSVYPYRESVSWAPDSHAMAVVAVVAGPAGSAPVDQLTIVPIDGKGAPRVLSEPGRTVGDVTWSPDGGRIAYASSSVDPTAAADGRRIWVVAPDGSDRHPVSPGPDDEFPQWSTQGDTLLFVHQTSDGAELWTVGRQGDDAHRVVSGLVGLRALPQQFFGDSGLVSYRGVFAWSAAAIGH